MKAETRKVTFLICPECGDERSRLDHLTVGTSFGPWYCDECGLGINGKVTADGPEIEIHKDRLVKTFVLLRLRAPLNDGENVHIVIDGKASRPYNWVLNLAKQRGHDEFLYNEHTCPTNYLRCEAIFDGDDEDPHGIFEYVDTIENPGIDTLNFGIDDWKALFTKLVTRG